MTKIPEDFQKVIDQRRKEAAAAGMSLRDYFAAHAPRNVIGEPIDYPDLAAGIIGDNCPDEGKPLEQLKWSMKVEAFARYAYADAMLKERAK